MADLLIYADHFLDELVNEAVLGVAYEAHRSLTRGTLFLDENTEDEEDNKYKITVENGLDIFGQPVGGSKKSVECVCPNCNRNMAASRFAPHLEKCMGMGRNSSRIASQRIANSGKMASSVNDALGVDEEVDDANDADWMAACESSSSRKTKKRKAERNNVVQRSSKSKNSPKVSRHSEASSNSDRLGASDPNLNISIFHPSTPSADVSSARTQNVNHTLSMWEKHINSTLSRQVRNASDLSASSASPDDVTAKRPKKPSKHQHSTKKSKKRHGAS